MSSFLDTGAHKALGDALLGEGACPPGEPFTAFSQPLPNPQVLSLFPEQGDVKNNFPRLCYEKLRSCNLHVLLSIKAGEKPRPGGMGRGPPFESYCGVSQSSRHRWSVAQCIINKGMSGWMNRQMLSQVGSNFTHPSQVYLIQEKGEPISCDWPKIGGLRKINHIL